MLAAAQRRSFYSEDKHFARLSANKCFQTNQRLPAKLHHRSNLQDQGNDKDVFGLVTAGNLQKPLTNQFEKARFFPSPSMVVSCPIGWTNLKKGVYVVLISFGALLKLSSVVLLIKTTDCQISLCKACLVFSEWNASIICYVSTN